MTRILLHVGTPKTGTSYLQDVLFRNQRVLAGAGILYPADRFDAHFLAALDLMQLPWGGLEREAVGAWDRLAGRVAESEQDTVIISHEILARAGRAHVERALTSLGRDRGAEVHVLVSARDLTRQIPAEWQENVKHRAELGYAEFLRQIAAPERAGRIASWFWGVQELPDILGRWAGDLPPEQVHLVTVPPPGSDPGLLWQRFTEAFGLAGLDLDLGNDRSNPSLGVPETALVRRINLSMNSQLPPPDYRPLVRELLAHQTLSQRRGSPRLSLPASMRGVVHEREQAWIEELGRRGYHVVGDLADLRGADPVDGDDATPWPDPDHPDEAAVADAALDAIGRLLTEAADARHEVERLRTRLAETERALAEAGHPAGHRFRSRVVGALERRRTGRVVLRGYRRLRRR
ncbi:hypothetical protein [Nocardioides sp. GY 10113]|uniref:hypothetical protein n=1 Tax=Nocardioides sp. GY 10113 TaxID=2569761 RepID=UPI001F0FA42F|nr:hypothetical protein [Nocardioides sp. GY 10113]